MSSRIQIAPVSVERRDMHDVRERRFFRLAAILALRSPPAVPERLRISDQRHTAATQVTESSPSMVVLQVSPSSAEV